jgi:hypothetical protein
MLSIPAPMVNTSSAPRLFWLKNQPGWADAKLYMIMPV